MKYLNVPSTAGALTIFKEAFEASNSAMSLGTVATKSVPITLRMAAVWYGTTIGQCRLAPIADNLFSGIVWIPPTMLIPM
jgi:hypothetical protein